MSESATFFLPAPAVVGGASTSPKALYGRRRYLDPKTRDYVVSGGALLPDDGFTSDVVLALSTRLGSAQAFPAFGSRLHEIKRADEQGRQLAEKHALGALQHLTGKVTSLKAVARLSKKPGGIDIEVSGRRGQVVVQAAYTAVLGP